MNRIDEWEPDWKYGWLSPAGAARLGVPDLAYAPVEYEPLSHEDGAAYAGEISYQGMRLGYGISLGRDGIVPCKDESARLADVLRKQAESLAPASSQTRAEPTIPATKTIRLRIRLDRHSHEYRLALASGFTPRRAKPRADTDAIHTQENMLIREAQRITRRGLLSAIRLSQRKDHRPMLHTKQHTSTAELDQQVISELAPQMKRRASRHTQSQVAQEIPVWKKTNKPLSRRRMYLSLALGVLCGLILIIVITVVSQWVGDLLSHWHGGDSYVSMIDADTGHDSAGPSHLLAFYRPGHIVLIECSHDYQRSQVYSTPASILDDRQHLVSMQVQVTNGHPVLLLSLDNNIAEALYPTSDGWSTTPPQ